MGALPAALLVHTVTVEPYSGEGAYGGVFGDPVTLQAFVEARRRRVLNDVGTQVTSTATIYMPLGSVCPPRSRITLPDGTTATAITTARHDGGGMPTPDHLEVTTA